MLEQGHVYCSVVSLLLLKSFLYAKAGTMVSTLGDHILIPHCHFIHVDDMYEALYSFVGVRTLIKAPKRLHAGSQQDFAQ